MFLLYYVNAEREMIILKKFIYIIIAVVLVLTLSGCGVIDKFFYKEPTTQATTESTTETTTTAPVITTTSPTTTESSTVPTTIPSTKPVTSAQSKDETEKTEVNDTTNKTEKDEEESVKLWARQDVNVRAKPTADSKKLGVLHEGNSIIRTGVSGSWYKVIFNDEEAYIYSSYLTDKEPSRTVSTAKQTIDPESDLWYLNIVNKDIQMPADYVPKLVEVASSGKYLDYRVAPHYNEMYAAAKKDGITLTPFSGYRSYARQQRNYNNLTESYMSKYNLSREEAAAKAATVILPPGTSEHNLGLAMDVCNTNSTFANQKEYKWLMEHAHEYGFILRYTAEKQSITGIIPEPWHWRYVGVASATEMKEKNLCLEEYLGAV